MRSVCIETILDPDEGRAEIRVYCDGQLLTGGGVGGEPEDNSVYRDYAWVPVALAKLAEALGATAERITTTTEDT